MSYARRSLVVAAVLALAGLALGVTPALAAKNCGRQIIDDWFKDGRVDKIYALHCYDEALDQLPNDVRTYSDAPQAIKRALQQALANGAPVDGNPCTTTPTETTPDEPTETSTEKTPTTTTPSDGPGGPTDSGSQALGDESSSASSVPLPLIVLAGLALLLLAAGGAGYLNRRRQAGRIDGGTDDGPPADV